MLNIVDDYSRFVWSYFLKQKSEVAAYFKQFLLEHIKPLIKVGRVCWGSQVSVFKTDNGTEFKNAEVAALCAQLGIVQEFSEPYLPEQNGCVERVNRTLVEMCRCLLHHSCLPHQFWAQAYHTAAHIRNRCLTVGGDATKTPYEMFFDKKPDVSGFLVFGCRCMVHLASPQQVDKKLGMKSVPAFMIGYTSNGYRMMRVVDASRGKFEVFVTREVVSVQEDVFFAKQPAASFAPDVDCVNENLESSPSVPTSRGVELVSESTSTSSTALLTDVAEPPTSPDFLCDSNLDVLAWSATVPLREADVVVPRTYAEAVHGSHATEWKAAMADELSSLQEHNTWVDLNASERISDHCVGSKWVFTVKVDENGIVNRFKARVVAQGFSQVDGIDFKETFSPVANRATMRLVLSLAVQNDMELAQMDVCTAFLNGILAPEERMVMKAPPGCSTVTGYVRLHRSLYGLKQAPRVWYLCLDQFLRDIGFRRCVMDHCLYVHNDVDGKLESFILVYVDDLVIGSKTVAELDRIKTCLHSKFKMKDLGELKYCLGLHFKRDRATRTIGISQEQYVNDTLAMFEMANCKPISPIMEWGSSLSLDDCPQSEEEKQDMESVPYRMAIGRLLYLSCCTRPDICYAVNKCAKYMANPGPAHWTAVKRIMRFLQGTKSHHLVIGRMISDTSGDAGYSLLTSLNCNVPKSQVLLGFSDADYAGCADTRRSTTGYMFFFNGPISWQSRLQTTVAKSCCDAEYMALSAAASEGRWLMQLLSEISVHLSPTFILFEDNTSAIALASHGRLTSRCKHIDIKYHSIQEYIERGILTVLYTPTNTMCADVLTKNLGVHSHQLHSKTLLG